MELRKKLGQLFFIGIKGAILSSDEEKFIKENNIGGVILFKHNYESPAQLAELTNSIQALRDEHPFFIGVDQEGGRVQRFKEPFAVIPAMRELANLDSPKLTYEIHELMARELFVCGINLNFSPCCDVLYNKKNKVIGDRSFGEDIETVEKHLSAAIRGLQANNVLAVAKHFPGHGSTLKDSHYDLPFIQKDLNWIIDNEIPTFNRATKSRVQMVMMAHLQIDAIDEDFPTSLSTKAYELLRKHLKFDRIIITDDMEMKAVADKFGVEKSVFMALKAGADLTCIRSFEKSFSSFEHVLNKANTDSDMKNFITEKFKRIEACKVRYLSGFKPRYIPEISDIIGCQKHKVKIQELTEKLANHS